MKINVIGTSGSGKTTFGRQLAAVLGIPFIELDAVFWGPNWSSPEDEELFAKLTNALLGENWGLDGNYTRTIPIKWERIDAVIWLDFSFLRTLYQALIRAIPRLFSQEELWPGTDNKESLNMLLSRDSIVLFTIKTYSRNRIKFQSYLEAEKYSHIHFFRLNSPTEAGDFLQKVSHDTDWLTGNI